VILLLALRNLFRHKIHSFLLILLISFITFIFFIGNSLITQSDNGLRKTYVENLTADLMIQRKSDISMNLFGANTPIIEEYFTIPTLPASKTIRAIVKDVPGIKAAAGIVSGKAVMDISGVREAVPLLGVEAPEYFDLFLGITLEKGRLLQSSEYGVMITSERAKSIESRTGASLAIGTPVKLTAGSDRGFKIREVPLVGIYSYDNPGPYMAQIILIDPQTVRALSSVLSIASQKVEVSEDATDLLGGDLDDLFGEEDLFSVSEDESTISLSELKTVLETDSKTNEVNWLEGDWNFLLMRVDEGSSISKVKSYLNNNLEDYDVNVVGWRTAAGNTALIVLMIQSLFYGGIFLVSLAGVISIINIVLISVFRRTKEIGTLRAIGCSDSYISLLIILENFILSFAAGVLGIVLGSVAIRFTNSLELQLSNSIIAALLGQNVLNISPLPVEAVKAAAIAVLLGITSAFYPAWRAVCIHPIEAVRRG